ncbi:phosphopantetheine-binding protein [Actinokineospora sp. PR83]|uniref:phosphopantetheine-binding protein n=1 Tax=Actinokineospora sp. PR83 TaxID=2884908 RepID=UPI001F395775|nr:phosphopantetheine-binding protein [Actinokineospora sp. PR83]MCG8915755.1 phosphopantetheine-binding protein [Actinokineospora sp. PR83]
MEAENPTGPPPPDERELRELVAPLVGIAPEDIPGGANLILLGLSSLDMMRLVGRWRRDRLPVVFEELAAAPTLDGWLAHLGTLRSGGGA